MITNKNYLLGRKKYSRPQAMLFANNAGSIVDGFYVPNGLEINAATPSNATPEDLDQYMILSDDNRGEISFRQNRIEKRERTINGRMRSYHVADKLTIDVSWSNLPSRSFKTVPGLVAEPGGSMQTKPGQKTPVLIPEGKSIYSSNNLYEYTTDGGAGGVELLDWYENHPGSFWLYLAYDNYSNFGRDESAYNNLNKYNEIIEVYFADFSYSVAKRGGTTFDLWNISMTLEEV